MASWSGASKQSTKDNFVKVKTVVDKYLSDGSLTQTGIPTNQQEHSEDAWISPGWEEDTLEERLERILSEMTPLLMLTTDLKMPNSQAVFSKKAQKAEISPEDEQAKTDKQLESSWFNDGALLKDTEQFSDLVVMTSLANTDSPMWNASGFEPGSETRTVDQLDTSDDNHLKSSFCAILNKVLEEWQSQRTEIELVVSKELQESDKLQEVSHIDQSLDLLQHVKPRVEALWWGPEVSLLST